MKLKSFLFAAAVGTLFSFCPMTANAQLFYSLDSTFSGTSPSGPPPWLSATFIDTGVNAVRLTMTTSGLSSKEFVGSWYFNLDPSINPNSLNLTRVSGTPPGTTTVGLGTDAFKADGDGYFDIKFSLPTSSSGRFVKDLSLIYDITGVGLSANSFNFTSAPGGGHGTWNTAAHIQNIGKYGKSGWIGGKNGHVPVPEPSTYLLLGTLLTTIFFFRRKVRA